MRKPYRIRWITPKKMNELREFKKAWKENPEGMLKRSAAGRRRVIENRKRRAGWLLQVVRTDLGEREMTSKGLVQVLELFIKNRQQDTNVPALIMRLKRYNVLTHDHLTGMWHLRFPSSD